MHKNKAQELIEKYISGTCTKEEIALLESWYLQYENKALPAVSDLQKKEQLDEIWKSLPVHNTRSIRRFHWIKIAAAVMFFVAIGTAISLYTEKTIPDNFKVAKRETIEIRPGSNKALLTLADGSTILLDDAKIGELSDNQGVKASKTKDGQLQFVIDDPQNDSKAANLFNTIETPKGGQYQVRLPDGTNVWLNAESSIRIPLAFSSGERLVSISGEAYFEVIKDKSKPFIVEANGVQVKVLGTHFNVKAYKDEREIKTTLTEGSVKLMYKDNEALLEPGEEGSIDTIETKFNIKKVDTEEVIAWKNGFFQFNGTNLYTLMKQLSRWYNIDVVYEPGVKNELFYGKIERSADLSKVLKILKLGDVNFVIESNRLIVKP